MTKRLARVRGHAKVAGVVFVRVWFVCSLLGAFAACGETTRGSAAMGGNDGTTVATGAGASSASTDGSTMQRATRGGTDGSVTSGGAGGMSAGSESSSGGGGFGGEGSGGGPWTVQGWRIDETAGCLEDESASFTIPTPGCGEAPSLQRDAGGQCWWIELSCDVEGLEYDDCSGVGDSPPPCGQGGAAGASGTSCDELGCSPSDSAGICGDVPGNVWICDGPFDRQALIDAGCVDLATQIPRYCCPDTFFPECL